MPGTKLIKNYNVDGNLIGEETMEISDEELLFEELDNQANAYHNRGIQAYNNWDSLTGGQKDTVLKELLGSMLSVLKRLDYFVL